MLLLPFLSIDDDTPFTLPTQLAQYIKLKLAKYNKNNLSPSGPSLDKKNDNGENHLVQDPHEQILYNVDELVKFTNLKKSLKVLYSQLITQGKQDSVEHPAVF